MGLIAKIIKATKSSGVIVAPLTDKQKAKLEKSGLKVGEVETPCGSGGHNTVSR